jgi:hypothetical protein
MTTIPYFLGKSQALEETPKIAKAVPPCVSETRAKGVLSISQVMQAKVQKLPPTGAGDPLCGSK